MITHVSFLHPQSYYFDRDDVALPGMKKFFKESSDEEREHAEKLMKVWLLCIILITSVTSHESQQ